MSSDLLEQRELMEQSETTGLPEVAKLPKSTVTTKMCTVFSRGGVRTVELEKLKRFQQQLYFFERIQRTKYSSAEILPVAKMLHLCVIVRGSLIVYPFGFHSQTQPVTIFRDAGCVFCMRVLRVKIHRSSGCVVGPMASKWNAGKFHFQSCRRMSQRLSAVNESLRRLLVGRTEPALFMRFNFLPQLQFGS